MANLFTSESKFIERSRVALTNADEHKGIKSALAEYDYNKAKIAEGWQFYNDGVAALKLVKDEKNESKIASLSYRKAYDALLPLYKRHRDLSLIYFKKNPEILIRLNVQGDFPSSYTGFFEKSKIFYTSIKDNADIQAEVLKIKISLKIVNDCLSKHKTLLKERANYDKEIGESQDATMVKNTALLELKNWMDDFDRNAKVALYDTPQLLEVLGIFVRS